MSQEHDWQYDLDEYIRQGEPDRLEKSAAWQKAIGLQDVDGLQTSDYLLETAKDHIEGKIDIATAQKRIHSYYEQRDTIILTVDKDAESEPFSEREMAYFPVKYTLNKSLNHTAIVIDKERKNWFIYILDNMDKSNLPDCFYNLADWYENDTFAAPICLDDLDICSQGFFTELSSKAYWFFHSYRRTQKEKWLKEEADRLERQRKQAEEARREAEIRRQEYECRLKEEEKKRRQQAEMRRAAAEAAKLKAAQAAEQKKQQRIDDEKTEIALIHQTTGGYVGSKTNGKYEINSLEALTATRPSRNWLCEYGRSHFLERINEIREYKQSGVRTLFAKLLVQCQ